MRPIFTDKELGPVARDKPLPPHFYSLDALRGLAALGVVFWHWHHFFYRGTELGAFEPGRQPFYGLLKPFYSNGWRAVDLFFCLSGFIFQWLHAARISLRATSPGEFWLHRFSRLYPLHLATLLVVAVGQWFMAWRHGASFVFAPNDAYHFGLQTLMVSGWGFERGFSFNGPAWSVSVEIFLYALFFLACRLGGSRWWQSAFLVVGGFAMMRHGFPSLGRGVISFFLGTLTFQTFAALRGRAASRATLSALGLVVGTLWVVIPLDLHRDLLEWGHQVLLAGHRATFHGKDLGAILVNFGANFAFELVLFPGTILTLALWEDQRGALGRRLGFLGPLSYSAYLLHFPLQLAAVAVAREFTGSSEIFYHPLTLVTFLMVLLLISRASYLHLERPCQSWIRAWGRQPAADGVLPTGQVSVNVGVGAQPAGGGRRGVVLVVNGHLGAAGEGHRRGHGERAEATEAAPAAGGRLQDVQNRFHAEQRRNGGQPVREQG